MNTQNIPEQTKDKIRTELELSGHGAVKEIADRLELSEYLVETVAVEKGLFQCFGCATWRDDFEADPDGFCELCQEEY